MGGVARRVLATLATLTSAPWRRAPSLLLRRPGVLAALAGAAGVLAAAVAAVPLFLSSTGTEALAVQVAERCPPRAGAEVSYVSFLDPGFNPPAGTPGQLEQIRREDLPDDPFGGLADLLDRRILTLALGVPTRLEEAGAGEAGDSLDVLLMARDGALDHIESVGSTTPAAGADERGMWVSDRAAEALGLAPGDQAVIGLEILRGPAEQPALEPVEVPVAGVYRDLAGYELDDFWCAMSAVLFPDRHGDLPPPLVLVDPDTLLAAASANPTNPLVVVWEASLGTGDMTVTEAEGLRDQFGCIAVLSAGAGAGAEAVECPDPSEGGRAFGPDAVIVPESITSDLPFMVDRARSIRTAVGGGVVPVAGFAALAGVGLVGAAASLWFDRRRQEVVLLTVRGVGPVAIGVKAVLELLVAALAGSAAGLGLAYGAVGWLGPSPTFEPAAVERAAAGTLGALVVAVLTIGTVVALRARTHESVRRRSARLALVPWELVLAGAAVVSYRRLGSWGAPVSRGAEVSRVDLVGLMFPVLFLAAAVAVAARVMMVVLGPLRSVSRRWSVPLFLAVRRVARARVAAVGLVAASAIAAGVLGYAATLTRSLNATLDVKAMTFIGSDVAVRLYPNQEVPPAVAERSTVVDVFNSARLVDGDEQAFVLAIDPETFARAAFWSGSFSTSSLEELLDRLDQPTVAGRIPALAVGAEIPETATVQLGRGGDTAVEIERVGEPNAFPGMETHRPTLVVAAAALEDIDATRVSELWVRGDPAETLAAFEAAGTGFRERRNIGDVVDQMSFLTVSWTFGFLQSLGIVAGILAMGGLTVYLDAQRRGRVLGYSFARRMGLTRSAHRRALLVELGATVVVGCWLGLTISLVGAWLAYDRLDPVPRLPPGPVLRVALGLVVVLAVAAAVVAGVAALLAQRRTDRDDPVEVLRAGV